MLSRARMVLLPAVLVAASVASLSSLASCGTDVNLGGTADGGVPDASSAAPELVDICEPCASTSDCPRTASCVQIAGTLTFCATACPNGTECEPDETCTLIPAGPTSDSLRACIPKTGACTPAKAPGSESAPVEHCGVLEGPTITAACRSCDADDGDCQRNGCYAGWWCNTTTNRCQRPPATCP